MKKALLYTAIIAATLWGLNNYFSQAPVLHRLLTFLGADFLKGGFIQILTWFMFFAGWENIRSQRKTMKTLAAEFTDKFLPQGNLLYFKDIEALHKNVATKTDNILGKLLRSTTSKLLIDRSTTNSIPLMESQLANVKNQLENQDTKLGFYVWAIPTIGFIGTVYGIATALGVADSAEISTITQYLGVAFDTTLLSLLLSVIITRTYHDLLASKEEYLNQLRGFVLENIISKTILNR